MTLGVSGAAAAPAQSCATPGAQIFKALSCSTTIARPAAQAARSISARTATAAAAAAARLPSLPLTARFSAIALSGRNACGYIKANRQVACWSGNARWDNSASDQFVKAPLKSIGVGAYGNICGLKLTGFVECTSGWRGGRQDPPSTRVTALSVGAYHACVLSPAGYPYCWVLGKSDARDIAEVAAVPTGLPRAAAISAGGYHTCIILTNGRVRCWGSDDQNQSAPPKYMRAVRKISAGGFHTCAIDVVRSVRCWGYNYNGQASPPRLNRTARQISAGLYHTCVVTTFNKVRCWGSDDQGQSSPPRGLGPVISVSAGSSSTCALTFSHLVRCWGDLEDTPDYHLTKVLVSRPDAIREIRADGDQLIGSEGRYRSNFCPSTSACQLYLQGGEYGNVYAYAKTGWGLSIKASPFSENCQPDPDYPFDSSPWCGLPKASKLKPTIVRIGAQAMRPCIVPNVVGLTVEAAEGVLSAKRCSLGDVTYDETSTVEAGRVIAQDWPAGSFRDMGEGIGVTVSGPAPD